MTVLAFYISDLTFTIENIYSCQKKNADLGPTTNLESQNSVSLFLSNVYL